MQVAFSFNTIVNAALPAIVADHTPTQVAKTAYTSIVHAAPNVAQLLVAWREGEMVKRAVDTSSTAIAQGLRAILKANKVDVDNAQDVRDALRGPVWADAGFTEIMSKPSEDKALAIYNTVSQRLSRIARAIVGGDAPAAQKVKAKVRVAKDLQAAINALKDEGFDRKAMLAAVARAFAA